MKSSQFAQIDFMQAAAKARRMIRVPLNRVILAMKPKISTATGFALPVLFGLYRYRGPEWAALTCHIRRAIKRLQADMDRCQKIEQGKRALQQQLFEDALDRLPFDERLRLGRFR